MYSSNMPPTGPALLCTQYYTHSHHNYQCGKRSCPPICNDEISPWLLYLCIFYALHTSHFCQVLFLRRLHSSQMNDLPLD